MNTGYFLPIDQDGFQLFQQSVEGEGWHQFDQPEPMWPTLLGITVPQDATGFTLQAFTDLVYCLSPEGANDGNAGMTLPAGGVLNMFGRESIMALCINLADGGDTYFTIQWRTGTTAPNLQLA